MSQAIALSADQQKMVEVWQAHLAAEFEAKSVDAALATMTADPHVLVVPITRGGAGRAGVGRFYGEAFLSQIPADWEVVPVSRTVGQDALVDEMIIRFTHDVRMDHLLPGVPPTGRRVEIAAVGIIRFEDGKIAHEHLYWDNASVLVQVGLLDPDGLPVVGAEQVRALLDPTRLG